MNVPDSDVYKRQALYKDREQNTWKGDMIHSRKGSRYDGVVEKVTAAIAERLTPEIRKTILGHRAESVGCAFTYEHRSDIRGRSRACRKKPGREVCHSLTRLAFL